MQLHAGCIYKHQEIFKLFFVKAEKGYHLLKHLGIHMREKEKNLSYNTDKKNYKYGLKTTGLTEFLARGKIWLS